MEKYETPTMEVTNFRKDVRTSNDIIIKSAIKEEDNNKDLIGPW